jgi:hypothetical protein
MGVKFGKYIPNQCKVRKIFSAHLDSDSVSRSSSECVFQTKPKSKPKRAENFMNYTLVHNVFYEHKLSQGQNQNFYKRNMTGGEKFQNGLGSERNYVDWTHPLHEA